MASVFEGLGRDQSILTSRARQMSLRSETERIVFHSTFNGTFDGWRQHQGGSIPYAPVSLSSYPVLAGTHALRIPIPANGEGSTYKNLSRWREARFATFSAFFTHWQSVSTAALGTWGMGIDTQFWDNSGRSFFRLVCRRDNDTGARTWAIRSEVNTYIDVPGATHHAAGDNENKYNWDFLSLTVDLSANGGLGGYHSAQINHELFDLTGLGAGNAPHDPQVGDPFDSFAGGWNCGVFASGGPTESALFMDEAVGSMS